MQVPKRKMSAQNVMLSITRTLGPRHESNQKASNEVIFAGEESKDKLYEPKHQQKAFRVMTVIAYIISVSLAAIILSLYYILIWNPKNHEQFPMRQHKLNTAMEVECVDPPTPNDLPKFSGSEASYQDGKIALDSTNEVFLEKQKFGYALSNDDGILKHPRNIDNTMKPYSLISPVHSKPEKGLTRP